MQTEKEIYKKRKKKCIKKTQIARTKKKNKIMKWWVLFGDCDGVEQNGLENVPKTRIQSIRWLFVMSSKRREKTKLTIKEKKK